MTQHVTYWLAAMLGAVTLTAGSARAASPTAIANCVTKGLQPAGRQFRVDSENVITACIKKVASAKLPPGTDCIGDYVSEMSGVTPSFAYNGAAHKKYVKLQKKLMSKCSGDDGVAGTGDDVGPDDLENAAGGMRFHPWGTQLDQESVVQVLTVSAELTQKGITLSLPGFSSGTLDDIAEMDCLALDPPPVWLAQPAIVRLTELYSCLELNSALAQLRGAQSISAPPVSMVKTRVAPVGNNGIRATYDASTFAFAMQVPAVPTTSRARLAGVGVCTDFATPCAIDPNAFFAASAPECGSGQCIPGPHGPDGITAADQPQGQLADGKCLSKLGLSSNGTTDFWHVRCMVSGVRNNLNAPVTTTAAGTCNRGPEDGDSCNSSEDCDPGVIPPRYTCDSGDEYRCEVDALAGSNPDNLPPCGAPCLAAMADPPGAGVGCGVGTTATCFVGTCSGGSRTGLACVQFPGDAAPTLGCPGGGTCLGVGTSVILTGDEVGSYFASKNKMSYTLCPFQSRFDFPMELVNGAGWIDVNLDDAPRNLCLPRQTSVQALGCSIREPGIDQLNDHISSIVSFVTEPSAPYADLTLPETQGQTGSPDTLGVGPIIGVGGGVSP